MSVRIKKTCPVCHRRVEIVKDCLDQILTGGLFKGPSDELLSVHPAPNNPTGDTSDKRFITCRGSGMVISGRKNTPASRASVIKQIRKLTNDLKKGKSLAGMVILGFECLDCCMVQRVARVQETGAHRTHCLWNYFVKCSDERCGYESNLAKYLGFKCRC